MAYYFTPGPPVAGMPQPMSDKPGLYNTYNGHIGATPMPIPTQRPAAMAGAPIIQPGAPMPQPGGPGPAIGLAGASPLTAPSPLTATTPGASPLQPGTSALHPGASQLPPGASPLQPGSGPLQPGTSPLQSGSSPYPVSASSSAPTYISALPSGMYASSAGLIPGATIAYPTGPAPPPTMAPPNMATNPYIGRPLSPYAAQGTPIHSVQVMQPPSTQTVMGGGFHTLAQAPVYTSQGYAVAQMPGTVYAYAAPSQAPHMVPGGALSPPYPQVMSQGLAGPGAAVQPGATYPRPPSMT